MIPKMEEVGGKEAGSVDVFGIGAGYVFENRKTIRIPF